MTTTTSTTPSLTPSRSPTPHPPVQPDHFYGSETPLPLSPATDGKTWLDPADDPLAQRGIPVFKPTMDDFRDFEAYMNRIECWGMKSGIVKVIPPKEWTDVLPPLNPQLDDVKLRNPIEQQMMGHGGLFRQQNIEKRRVMSVREWAELCAKEEHRAPGVKDVGLHARATNGTVKNKPRRGRRKTREPETAEPEVTPAVMVKEEDDEDTLGISVSCVIDEETASKSLVSSPDNTTVELAPITPADTTPAGEILEQPTAAPTAAFTAESTTRAPPLVSLEIGNADGTKDKAHDDPPKRKGRRNPQTREAREAALAERADKDREFLARFDPRKDWLPPNTTNDDYTPEFCKELERRYWRNCGLGKSAWYGADMAGSLFTDDTKSWNVAHLESALSRLLPASSNGLPGVNTPYLYFGMWRATFAWHVEDMDLFSINYIHFGAPKFWYAVPQARAGALEQTMRNYFPKDTSNCPQFLRHKSYLASPKVLLQGSCRPNYLVQREGEFVITYPRGYHAGFNLGFNCAESVNFALDSWLEMGRVAKVCECVDFSVRIDVDQLLHDRELERQEADVAVADSVTTQSQPSTSDDAQDKNVVETKVSRKRKSDATGDMPKAKKSRAKIVKGENTPGASAALKPPKVTLKLGPKPQESDVFPCCLCVSTDREGLLRVHNPPVWQKEGQSGEGSAAISEWQAHEECANVIPETWVDDFEVGPALSDGMVPKERMVFGTDAIPKDRWNLKCNACLKTRQRAHGAPIQCTKGKCPKAYHVSCARDGTESGISYRILREVENDVLLSDSQPLHADNATAMETDDGARVLSLVRKLEVEVLCPQHNPVMLEARKAAKQDKIRSMLVALPLMTRIKLRVSAGVFEVSLVRVIEETGCVEVLWDRGHKREFKWSSVVFGNSDNIVGQKPTEMAPEPQDLAIAPVALATPVSEVATTSPSQSSSFYLPLGPSCTMEVRRSQYAQTPPHNAPSPAYLHAYQPPYNRQPYPSTPYQMQTTYHPGTWSYQYHGQPPQYVIGQPQGASTVPARPSPHVASPAPEAGPSAAQYGYCPMSNSQPTIQHSTGQTVASMQTASQYTQQRPYIPYPTAPYAQSTAATVPYTQHCGNQFVASSTPSAQNTIPAVYQAAGSPEGSRSQTPTTHGLHELRWQQPYQGPKTNACSITLARASQPVSRASSVRAQSRHTSGPPSVMPMDPHHNSRQLTVPEGCTLPSSTSLPVAASVA